MQLKKTFLTAAILASSLVLTACNEKKADTKTTEATTQQQVEKQKAPTEQKIQPTTLALYNASINITPVSINFTKNKDNTPLINYNFVITNTSNKAIVGAAWANIITLNNQIIDIVPISSQGKLVPQQKSPFSITKPLNTYPKNIQAELLTKGVKLNLNTTVAGTLIFNDNSSVTITPANILDKVVKEQLKIIKTQNVDAKKVEPKKADTKKADTTK